MPTSHGDHSHQKNTHWENDITQQEQKLSQSFGMLTTMFDQLQNEQL